MTHDFSSDILPETEGLMLCKIVGEDELKLSEPVMFERGRPAILMTLSRARLSGHVGGGIDGATRYWADQLNSDGDTIGEIALDQNSWNSLKNHWMRCKLQECVFRRIRPPIPTTCAHLFRGIRPPVTRCREAACFGYQS